MNTCALRPRGLGLRWVMVSLVTAALAAGCAVGPRKTYTSVRQHSDFVGTGRKLDSVAVLPVQVEYTRATLTGDNERLTIQEREIGRKLVSSAVRLLGERGFRADDRLARPGDPIDPDFNFRLEQVRSSYSEASKELYREAVTVGDADKFRVSIGPVVNPIAVAAKTDAVLLMRYAGFRKSGGMMTKDVITGALWAGLTGVQARPAKGGGVLEIALIDGVTGDVLWTNGGVSAADPQAMVSGLLADLPNHAAVTQVFAKP